MGELIHVQFPENKEKPLPPATLEQLSLDNVIPIEEALGSIAARETDPYQDLSGGILTAGTDRISRYRSEELEEFNNFNIEFQGYVRKKSAHLFDEPNGKSFALGMWTVQNLVNNSSGFPETDISDYIRVSGKPTTERQRAVRVLQCEGLGILEDALKRPDLSDASAKAVEEIGGSYANLHTDRFPGGAVERFEGIIVSTDRLLKTYVVYRTIDGHRRPTSDPVTVIQTLRREIAKSAGFASHRDINKDDRQSAWKALHPDPAA